MFSKGEMVYCKVISIDVSEKGLLENLSLGFQTKSTINRAVQPQNLVKGLKFQIYESRGNILSSICTYVLKT